MSAYESNLCMGCMEDGGGAEYCAYCGYRKGSPAESPIYLNPGTVLQGQYVVGRKLGHGGFGITYIGWDLNLARKIAIKEYFPSGVAMRMAGNSAVYPYSGKLQTDYNWGLDRYVDEARVVARFQNHPLIVWVQNFFRANGTAYMIMEFLHGRTFEAFLLERGGRVSVADSLTVLMPVMEALKEVHAQGLLHRDISPDNIYILDNYRIKVIDFGAARYALGQHSKNLSVILKPGYAPPEQYLTKGDQGPWTDVYAIAATFYRAVTGDVPQPSLDRGERDEVLPPSQRGVQIAPNQERAIMKALNLRADERFPDMTSFQDAVSRLGDEPPRPAPLPPQPGPQPVPPRPQPQPPYPQPYPQPGPYPQPLPGPVPIPSPFPMPRPQPQPAPSSGGIPQWAYLLAGVGLLIGLYFAFRPGGPTINSFTASPSAVKSGETVTLAWNVKDAEDVSIDTGVGTQPAIGTVAVQPTKTTRYTLTARAKDGKETHQSIDVTVAAPKVKVVSFTASPSSIHPGDSSQLVWKVDDATEVTINGTTVNAQGGDAKVEPTATATYKLVAKASDGSTDESTVTVTVEGPTAPQIVTFEFDPAVVNYRDVSICRWDVRNATSARIDPPIFDGFGPVALPSGTKSIHMYKTSTYRLVVDGPGGSNSASATITVNGTGLNLMPRRDLNAGLRPPLLRYFDLAGLGTN